MLARGWRNGKNRHPLTFFFSSPRLTPSPLLPYIVIFRHVYWFFPKPFPKFFITSAYWPSVLPILVAFRLMHASQCHDDSTASVWLINPPQSTAIPQIPTNKYDTPEDHKLIDHISIAQTSTIQVLEFDLIFWLCWRVARFCMPRVSDNKAQVSVLGG